MTAEQSATKAKSADALKAILAILDTLREETLLDLIAWLKVNRPELLSQDAKLVRRFSLDSNWEEMVADEHGDYVLFEDFNIVQGIREELELETVRRRKRISELNPHEYDGEHRVG